MQEYKAQKSANHTTNNYYTVINNQYNINYINFNYNSNESFIPLEEKENYNENGNIILMGKNEPCMHAYIDDTKCNFNDELITLYKTDKKNNDNNIIYYLSENLEEKEKNELELKCFCLRCNKYITNVIRLNRHYNLHNHNLYINFKDWSLLCLNCKCKYSLEYLNHQKKFRILFQFLREKKFRPPKKLQGLTEPEINYIKYKNFIHNFKNKNFKKILFMVGAGISTSAGIPDFRSETGLFKQLQKKYKLDKQEEFFTKKTFLKNPEYFYDFLKDFNLDKYTPTIAHMYMNFLIKKNNIVKYIFTQNIDGLEKKANIPNEKIIYAHGNFNKGHCAQCNNNIDINIIKNGIKNNKIIKCPKCNGPCKPKIVFYGEKLPKIFFEKMDEIKLKKDIDLIIIMGTSLNVVPFTDIPKLVNPNVYKVLFNLEKVGKYSYDKLTENSLFIQGTIDNNIIMFLKDVNLYNEFCEFISMEYNIFNIDEIINKKNNENFIEIENNEISLEIIEEIMIDIDKDFYLRKFK